MCTVCGCNEATTASGHHHHDEHQHDEHHHHHHEGHHDYSNGSAGLHIAGISQERIVRIEQDILAKNNGYATSNRDYFAQRAILTLNLVSSPGSGKTSLLERTLTDLKDKYPLAVIEGDQQTAQDADRIRTTGVPAVQINTGRGCHLDAHMVGHAIEDIEPQEQSLLFIENVGNLVCPASFDLGEYAKVAILSVTEGEDKPIKYPDMFAASRLMLLNKTDLLPHLDFDLESCIACARRVNPEIQVLKVSARTGEGMDKWYQWLGSHLQLVKTLQEASH